MSERFREKLSSPEAALFAQSQLQSEFQRLEVIEVPARFNDRNIICGNGRLQDHPDDFDSINRFEFRQDANNGNVTYVEFQDLVPSSYLRGPDYVRYFRFRLPGWPPAGDTPRVVMDAWSVSIDIHSSSAREKASGMSVGATVLESLVYGRNRDLESIESTKLFMALAKLEDGVSYHISASVEDEARLSGQKAAA